MLNLTRYRGDTNPDKITVLSQTTGEPINISGYSFILTVDPYGDPASAASNLYSLNGSITDAVNGVVEFTPSALQADLVGDFFYDIQMTDASGRKRTISRGQYTYLQDITK